MIIDADFKKLKLVANELVRHYKVLNGYTKIGSVACALITEAKNIYTGISVEVVCGIGFCAEHSAIAEMLKNGETQICKLIAIHHDVKIIPPCGRCRELMRLVNNENMKTRIMISPNTIIEMNQLLPYPFVR